MAVTNYGELKVVLRNYLTRESVVGQGEVPGQAEDDLIAAATAQINADLRLRFMEEEVSVPISLGSRETALPTGYRQGKVVYLSNGARLEYENPVPYWALYANLPQGTPQVFSVQGGNYLWGPVPNADLTAKALVYKEIEPLVNDGDTNELFDLAWIIYIYAAMVEAVLYLGDDERTQVWVAKYEDIVGKLQDQDNRDRYSGDTREASVEAQRT